MYERFLLAVRRNFISKLDGTLIKLIPNLLPVVDQRCVLGRRIHSGFHLWPNKGVKVLMVFYFLDAEIAWCEVVRFPGWLFIPLVKAFGQVALIVFLFDSTIKVFDVTFNANQDRLGDESAKIEKSSFWKCWSWQHHHQLVCRLSPSGFDSWVSLLLKYR